MIDASIFGNKGWARDDILSPEEIPIDATLSNLHELLDANAARDILRYEVPEYSSKHQLALEKFQILYARYRPNNDCIVCYRVDVHDRIHACRDAELVVVKAFAEAPSQEEISRRTQKLKSVSRYGPRFAYLADRKLAVTTFPNDPRMHRLYKLFRPKDLERMFRQFTAGANCQLNYGGERTDQIRIMSYKPERSCLIQFRTGAALEQGGDRRTVYARIYHGNNGIFVNQGMSAVWNGVAQRSGQLRVAHPIGYNAINRIFMQSAVPGTPLAEQTTNGRFCDYVSMAAESLAMLHKMPGEVQRRRTVANELASNEKAAVALGCALPHLRGRLAKLMARLRETMPQGTTLSLIHGDFSSNQVMVDGDSVYLIDFDRVALGDPYIDLGDFLARLEKTVFLAGLPFHIAETGTDAFRRSYEAAHGECLNEARLLWHWAVGYTRGIAYSHLRNLRLGWRERVESFVARAEAVVEQLDAKTMAC